MTGEINNIDDFTTAFPNAEWLEDSGNYERWSNGLGENTDYESEWFDVDTGLLIDDTSAIW